MDSNILHLKYSYTLNNGKEKVFLIKLQRPSMTCVAPRTNTAPAWTFLNCHKCENCPLDSSFYAYCPIALNLVEVLDFFKRSSSFEEVEVRVFTANRDYFKKTSLQEGIGSLIGLYMVTSGCPVMDNLRPMILTHLPFATLEETTYRAVSMYLLAQYFLYKSGQDPDWDLQNLAGIYEGVNQVNKSFTQRILSINERDANLNALVRLDCFALRIHTSIMRDSLDTIRYLFHAYLDDAAEEENNALPRI